jgi:aspartyl-tRNA(Asn)/glutamyl-tRNA(Gln) amidotransferase subunit C
MEISEKLVNHIAHLARLEFKGEEKSLIIEDMRNIISLMDKLRELPTEHIEPLVFMTDEFDHLREDKAEVSITHEEALLNAPKKDSDYFRIPKVLDK